MQISESFPEKEISFAQAFEPRTVYTVKNDAVPIAGSERTAYRRLVVLESLGLANFRNGRFQITSRVSRQPPDILKKLLPSLIALKNARRFGKFYNDSDIRFMMKHAPEDSLVTLDFKAWDITKFQTPSDLFIYVDDVEEFATFLKKTGFSEGKNGHIVLLSKAGNFANEIERVYLDCIAKGGRSTLDAIAIDLLYGDKLSVRGQFPIEMITKVQEDMPPEMINVEASS